MREYTGPTKQAGRLAFIPGDPPRLVAVSHRDAHVWDLDRPDPVATWPLPGEPPRSAEPVASADGRWLALLPGGRPTLYDLGGGAPPVVLGEPEAVAVRFAGRPERVCAVRVARSKADLVLTTNLWPAPSSKGTLDPKSGTTRVLPAPRDAWKMDGPGWEAYGLSADGRRVAVSYRTEALHVWDTESGAGPKTARLTGLPKGMAFSPDGSRIVVDVGTVYVHDARTLEVLVQWKAKYSYAPGLAWSPDGRLLARTDDTTTVRLYDASTGRQVSALGAKRGRYASVAFAPDGLTFAAGAVDGTVRVWDVG